MRDQTEWVEYGVDILAGSDGQNITQCTEAMLDKIIEDPLSLYGGGNTSQNIVNLLESYC